MGITIISQNTAERKQETIELFQQCKPYLDEGKSLLKSVQIVKQLNYHTFTKKTWYQDLQRYAESQGYPSRR